MRFPDTPVCVSPKLKGGVSCAALRDISLSAAWFAALPNVVTYKFRIREHIVHCDGAFSQDVLRRLLAVD